MEFKWIDLHYVLQLTKGNTTLIQECIQTFFVESKQQIKNFEYSLIQRNDHEMREALHALRALTNFFGASVCDQKLRQLKDLILTHSLNAQIENKWAEFKNDYDLVCIELRNYIVSINDQTDNELL